MINFDVCNSSTILPPIVLFFHQDVHLIYGVHGAILFDVVGKWLSQADHCNSAFMKNLVAHQLVRISLNSNNGYLKAEV